VRLPPRRRKTQTRRNRNVTDPVECIWFQAIQDAFTSFALLGDMVQEKAGRLDFRAHPKPSADRSGFWNALHLAAREQFLQHLIDALPAGTQLANQGWAGDWLRQPGQHHSIQTAVSKFCSQWWDGTDRWVRHTRHDPNPETRPVDAPCIPENIELSPDCPRFQSIGHAFDDVLSPPGFAIGQKRHDL
jgi:hypothetical protein